MKQILDCSVVILAAFVSAIFFVSFWGRDAEGLGAHDMGWALALSFTMPIALYASFVLAAVALISVSISLGGRHRRSVIQSAVALVLALLPLVFLTLVD